MHTARVSGEKKDADIDAAEAYLPKLAEQIRDMGITLDAVYNLDETGLIYKKTFSKTLLLPTEKRADGRKVPKQRITLMVCAIASGTHRTKPR